MALAAKTRGPGLVLLALGAAFAPVEADACAPEKLVRIVTENVTPGIEKGSFAAAPKIVYRIGSRHARLEEELDPAQNVHMLIVISAPRIWTVDRVSKTARLALDPDPTPDVRIPIFAEESLPAYISEAEFGCEAAFIARMATSHERSVSGKEVTTRHSIRAGAWKLTLVTREGQETPEVALLLKDEKVIGALRYRTYEVLDETPPGLFEPPAGIQVTEEPAAR